MAVHSPENSETNPGPIVEKFPIRNPLRRVIADSWNRSAAAGVATAANKVIFHRVDDADLRQRQLINKDLMRAAVPHLNWLSAWLANIPHVVYLVDRDGIILFSVGNYDNADAFGLTPGFNWSEEVMGTNGAGTAIAADRALAVIGSEHISEPFQGFTWMGAPIHDPEGQVCGAIDVSTSAEDANPERLAVMAHIAFVIDGVLSQQRAADMAKRKLAAKDRLLAEVSHELRTPLTAILGWTQVLKKRAVDELPAQALEIIERNALKQGRLIEDLLDVSRCLTGHLSIECSAVALGPLIKQAVDSLRQSADAKQQTLSLELEDTELTVIGDARRLDQVMSNLVGNAIKYTPEGGRIDVKLERVGSDALITVRDNGIGISPAFLPHIFDYFQRAQRAEVGRDTGLGLGLPIVLEIVKLHHGVIEAHSDGEGRGTTMHVRLPLLGGN